MYVTNTATVARRAVLKAGQTSHLVNGKLGAGRHLFERDIPVLAATLEDHVHEAQKSNLLLGERGATNQSWLRRHRLQRARKANSKHAPHRI